MKILLSVPNVLGTNVAHLIQGDIRLVTFQLVNFFLAQVCMFPGECLANGSRRRRRLECLFNLIVCFFLVKHETLLWHKDH